MHMKKLKEKEDRTFYAIAYGHGLRTGRGIIFRPVLGGKTSGPTRKGP